MHKTFFFFLMYFTHPPPHFLLANTLLFSISMSLVLVGLVCFVIHIPHVKGIVQHLSLSDIFHLAKYPLDSSTVLQMG